MPIARGHGMKRRPSQAASGKATSASKSDVDAMRRSQRRTGGVRAMAEKAQCAR